MTPKTDTPEPIKQLDVKNLTDQQMGLIESLINKFNKMKAKGAI